MGRALVYLLQDLDRTTHFREMRRETGLAPASLLGALRRLEELGLVEVARRGGRTTYQVRAGHPATLALTETVRRVAEPAEVLAVAFGALPGLEAALLFGSLATGRAGPASDVDVLLVGEGMEPDAVERAARGASRVLGREVNVTLVRPADLREAAAAGNPFVHRILTGAVHWFAGEADRVFAPPSGSRPAAPHA
jgi:predicted nucleotidyltransferase